jgi:hypothetical protein
MSYWQWDSNSKRYRVTVEGAEALNQRVGTYVSNARMLELRESVITSAKNRVNELASSLASGDININQWTLAMRQEVKDSFIHQYMLGHGGRNTMTQSDWGKLGHDIRDQYQYLNRFSDEIRAGRYTESQIAARSRMYMEASSQSFEKAKVASRGIPDLPDYPGSGRTECMTNCKCYWNIKETETEWLCYWSLSNVEHCDSCIDRSNRWNPLVISKNK